MKGIEKLQCELFLLSYLDRFMFGSKNLYLKEIFFTDFNGSRIFN